MTIEKIKTASEVITNFLDTQSQDENLEPNTLEAIRALWDEGKLTKINLVRQLEVNRKVTINPHLGKDPTDD